MHRHFWYGLTRVVLDKGLLNGCVSVMYTGVADCAALGLDPSIHTQVSSATARCVCVCVCVRVVQRRAVNCLAGPAKLWTHASASTMQSVHNCCRRRHAATTRSTCAISAASYKDCSWQTPASSRSANAQLQRCSTICLQLSPCLRSELLHAHII